MKEMKEESFWCGYLYLEPSDLLTTANLQNRWVLDNQGQELRGLKHKTLQKSIEKSIPEKRNGLPVERIVAGSLERCFLD